MSAPRSAAQGPRRWIRIAVIALAGLLFAAVTGFVFWGLTPLGPSEAALSALEPGQGVDVTTNSWGVSFAPESGEATAGLVIYPGGHVDYRSYAPLARQVAEAGYAVAIVKVPLSLAILGTDAAADPIDQEPGLAWAVSGHSLGGVAAAGYAAKDGRVSGLMMLASYPTEDVSNATLNVVDVTATLDGVLNQTAWSEAATLLPTSTERVSIEGGNHAQFGSYGPQPGDNTATISESEQRDAIADAATRLLARLNTGSE